MGPKHDQADFFSDIAVTRRDIPSSHVDRTSAKSEDAASHRDPITERPDAIECGQPGDLPYALKGYRGPN